jgi:glycosyltransferase involved in cell wall biosynthesis
LIDLAGQLNIAGSVRFEQGLVPIAQLVPIVLEADAGIVPILYDEFTRHMLPVKLLEYVALDLPVICSRTETIQAYFDDSMVQYFEPGNAAELTEQVRLLYHEPGKRARLTANASKFNREYNWEQQKLLYYRLIDDLAGQTLRLQGKGHAPGREAPALGAGK